MIKTRRNFLALAGLAPVAILGARQALAQAQPACYNPAALPLSQKSLRRSMSFQDTSTDPKKHCSLCAFFVAGQAGCGTCQILSGGPVTANSVCSSFAPKPGAR